MKKVLAITLTAVLVLSGVLISASLSPASAGESTVMEFNSMAGIPSAFTGNQQPIRGINGGGLPWELTSAQGRLSSSGKLELQLNGLVLATGPNAGSNPIANFRAIVSCLTSDGSVDNEMSGLFPAKTGIALTGGGDSHIQTTLTLPQPCLAPIIFVTSPGGAWFAVTGK